MLNEPVAQEGEGGEGQQAPAGGGGGGGPLQEPGVIQITPEERAAIDNVRVLAMFSMYSRTSLTPGLQIYLE